MKPDSVCLSFLSKRFSNSGVSEQCLERINRLADEIGSFIQYWGFKSIHGKVWTHLYLSPEPLDAANIMKRLKISKSLVSITLADLLQYKVVESIGRGPKDTMIYRANPNIREVILDVLKNRELRMFGRLQKEYTNSYDLCLAEPEGVVDPAKLKALGQMIEGAAGTLSAIIELRNVDFNKAIF